LDKLILSSIDSIQISLFSRGKFIERPMNRMIYSILSNVLILGLVISPFTLSINAESNGIISPKKQMETGVKAEEVKCKSGLVLMIRSTNGSAACLKSTTSTKLSEAGWGIIIDLSMEEETPVEPVKQPESEEKKTEGTVIEVKINDGIGSKDR
jgi:hypothetical protein